MFKSGFHAHLTPRLLDIWLTGTARILHDLTLRVLALPAGASEASTTAAYKDHDDGGVSVWDPVKGLSRRSILDRIELSNFQSSTKIEALMEVS
jgi:hypothetical protein